MDSQENSYDIRRVLIIGIATVWVIFQLYTGVFGTFSIFIQRGLHLAFGIPLIFLVFPTFRKRKCFTIDLILACISGLTFSYVAYMNDEIVQRLIYVDPLTNLNIVIGLTGILLVLEAARRTVGSLFASLAFLFFAYIFFGGWIPGIFGHRGFDLKIAIEQMFFTSDGIFGIPVGVSSTYVFLFIMFGVFLERTGAGKFFMDFVTCLVGHKIGGPAKVSVFSSATMGMISGSAIANVVTTGAFTIPLMRKIGFDKEYAAGVESMASTGGQLTPPILGVAAFIMAQFSGYSYSTIAAASIIPAILYYNSALWQIHFYSLRKNIPCIPKDECPATKTVFRSGWFYIVPLIVIVVFLVKGYTPTTAAIYGLFTCICMNLIFGDRRKLSPMNLLLTFEKTARTILIVIGAVSAAGIIIGSLNLTGLGVNISNAIISLARNSQLPALFFTAIIATILGLGLPTSGAYIVCAAVLVPSLINIGVPTLAAHFFALFYASLSVITPPVALASYTAASVADANPWITGIKGFKLGLAAYIVPFFFVYNTALLGQGSIWHVVMAAVSGLIGTFALAASIEGWVRGKLKIPERALLAIGSILLIFPGILTDISGIICIILALWKNTQNIRREIIQNIAKSS